MIPVAGYVIAMLGGLPGLLSIISLLAAGMLAIWLLEDVEAASPPSRRGPRLLARRTACDGVEPRSRRSPSC